MWLEGERHLPWTRCKERDDPQPGHGGGLTAFLSGLRGFGGRVMAGAPPDPHLDSLTTLPLPQGLRRRQKPFHLECEVTDLAVQKIHP